MLLEERTELPEELLLERVALELPEELLERVELEDELERVAEPLLVLVCAAISGAVSMAIAIKTEAA